MGAPPIGGRQWWLRAHLSKRRVLRPWLGLNLAAAAVSNPAASCGGKREIPAQAGPEPHGLELREVTGRLFAFY